MDQTPKEITEELETTIAFENKRTLAKTLSAGQWYFVNMVSQKIFTFGTFFITARLLTPADFGIIAVATIYPTLIDAMTAVAFEAAAIQKKIGEEKSYLNAIWTFNIIRAIFIFALTFLTAPLVAKFFHAEGYLMLFRLSGLVFLMQGWTNIGQIYFFRDLDFKKVFFRDLVLQITTSIISIGGAFLLHSYWALFIANSTAMFFTSLITYVLSPYRPHIDLKFIKLKPLLGYSQWIFGQGLLSQAAKTFEDVLVAHFTSARDVGLLSKTKGLSHAPTSPLSSIISKISFSAFSRVQESVEYVREGLYKSIDLLTVIALPFLVGIFIAGHRLVLILLGAQWVDISTNLSLLTLAATLDTIIITLAQPTFNALGHPRLYFIVNSLYLATLLVALPVLVPLYGIHGAAIALLIASIIGSIATLVLIHQLIHLSWKRIGETFGVVSLGILLPLPLASFLLSFPFANQTAGFLLLATGSGIIYIGTILFLGIFLKKGPYNTLVVIVKSFYSKK